MLRTLSDNRSLTDDEFNRLAERMIESASFLPCSGVSYKHYFVDGVYLREMHFKAGTFVVGAIHKRRTLTVVSKGKLKILMNTGMQTVSAPQTIVTPPRARRIGLALEDTVAMNICRTNALTVEEAEREWAEDPLTLIGRELNPQMLRAAHEEIKHISHDTPESRWLEHVLTDDADPRQYHLPLFDDGL